MQSSRRVTSGGGDVHVSRQCRSAGGHLTNIDDGASWRSGLEDISRGGACYHVSRQHNDAATGTGYDVDAVSRPSTSQFVDRLHQGKSAEVPSCSKMELAKACAVGAGVGLVPSALFGLPGAVSGMTSGCVVNMAVQAMDCERDTKGRIDTGILSYGDAPAPSAESSKPTERNNAIGHLRVIPK